MMLRAAAAIVFGLIAIFLPGPTLAALVLLFAAYMFADGIFAIVAGVRAARRQEGWGWFALEALADIAAGLIAFLWPGITILVFVLIAAAWALVSGAIMLYGAFRFRENHGRFWLVFGGLVSAVWGALLLVWPMLGALAITLWLGAYALVFGIALLFLGLRLRRESKKPVEQLGDTAWRDER